MTVTRSSLTVKWKILPLLLLAQTLHGQARHDADELIRTGLANYEVREAQAKDYEYTERDTMTRLGNVKTTRRSTTYEIMVIDGRPYRRELRDGKPMTPEEEEQERQRRADEARRDADEHLPWPKMAVVTVSPGRVPKLMFNKLTNSHEVRWKKEEMLDGRNTYVLEAKPKHGEKPSDEIESDLRTFKMTIWIDQADAQIMRIRAVAIHPGVLGYAEYTKVNPAYYPKGTAAEAEHYYYATPERYSQGTVITMEWRKINDEAWLPTRVHIKGAHLEPHYLTPLQKAEIRGDGSTEWPFEDETVFYDYKKFQVTHRILPSAPH